MDVDRVRPAAQARLQSIADHREERRQQRLAAILHELNRPRRFLFWKWTPKQTAAEELRAELDSGDFGDRGATFGWEFQEQWAWCSIAEYAEELEKKLIGLLRLCDQSPDGKIHISSEDANNLKFPVQVPAASETLAYEAAVRELNQVSS